MPVGAAEKLGVEHLKSRQFPFDDKCSRGKCLVEPCPAIHCLGNQFHTHDILVRREGLGFWNEGTRIFHFPLVVLLRRCDGRGSGRHSLSFRPGPDPS
jgi:hypothetical protein